MSGMRLGGWRAGLTCCLLCAVTASTPASDEEPLADRPLPKSIPPENQLTVDQLIDALGSPNYDERRQATDILKAKKKSFADELTRLYRLEHDHEIRLRLVEVAEHIFLKQALQAMGGFMGIQPNAVDGANVPGLDAGRMVIRVDRVLPHTAAERAKLKFGDLILAIDGEEVPVSSGNAREFIKLIGSKPPGTEVEFQVLRADELFTTRMVLGVKPLSGLNRIFLTLDQREALREAGTEFTRWRAELKQGE